MDDSLIDAFEDCLNAIERGASLEECLQKYPHLAEELRPRLNVIILANHHLEAIRPPAGLQAAGRERFLAQAARLKTAQALPPGARPNGNHRSAAAPAAQKSGGLNLEHLLSWLLRPLASSAIRVATILLVVVFAGAGVLGASAQSLPGTPLYGLKRTIEEARLSLAPSDSSRAQLESEFSERRRQELEQVTDLKLSVAVEFGGSLSQFEAGKWIVDGKVVILPAGARVDGAPQQGLYVWVQGRTQADGTVLADEALVEGLRFVGKVTSIQAGVWQFADRDIYASDGTRIEGSPQAGDTVAVNVWILPGGNWLAEEIQLVERAGAPGDTPQPTPVTGTGGNNGPDGSPGGSGAPGGSSASPTQPAATSGSQGGPGPSPTQTPGPAKTPEPTRTLEPTRTPEPGKTSQPTSPPAAGSSLATPTGFQSQEVRLQGLLQSVSGSAWVVDGQAFVVNAATAIEGSPQLNDLVEVRANPQPDGSLLATRISKKN